MTSRATQNLVARFAHAGNRACHEFGVDSGERPALVSKVPLSFYNLTTTSSAVEFLISFSAFGHRCASIA